MNTNWELQKPSLINGRCWNPSKSIWWKYRARGRLSHSSISRFLGLLKKGARAVRVKRRGYRDSNKRLTDSAADLQDKITKKWVRRLCQLPKINKYKNQNSKNKIQNSSRLGFSVAWSFVLVSSRPQLPGTLSNKINHWPPALDFYIFHFADAVIYLILYLWHQRLQAIALAHRKTAHNSLYLLWNKKVKVNGDLCLREAFSISFPRLACNSLRILFLIF